MLTGPNQSATKDKSDLNSSPSDALLQTDPDNKAFYENLPFHGIQNPPNKVNRRNPNTVIILPELCLVNESDRYKDFSHVTHIIA